MQQLFKKKMWLLAVPLAMLMAGCSSNDNGSALALTAIGGPAPVNLGTAGNFAILAKSGISTVPTSAVTGDMGVSPIAATAMTGFSLILDSTGTFSTSSQVTGKAYAADYTSPTPSNLTTAVSNMEAVTPMPLDERLIILK